MNTHQSIDPRGSNLGKLTRRYDRHAFRLTDVYGSVVKQFIG